MKINKFAHIAPLIDELKPFFNICELDNNTYRFSLNTVSKALVTKKDKFFRFTQARLSKIEEIATQENKKQISLVPEDIQYICEALNGYNLYFARKVIREICKTCRDNVKNFLGYTKSIMEGLSDNYQLI